VRKSVFDLDKPEVKRLQDAYAALRKLATDHPDDPRGWLHQGQVHCWYCTGALDSLNGMEIHGSWWFLAWHRCYLYFHERILGELIGDPTFALAYWDWDSCKDDPKDKTGRNRFPGEVFGFSGDTSNPLFDPTRAVGPNDRIDTAFVGPTTMKPIMDAKSFAEFGGSGNEELPVFDQSGGGVQQMGSLEAGPHGLVHVWTTDPKGFSGAPDMGSLASAGFDPVFFAHHANIDRLWDKWAQAPGHANPNNPRWLNIDRSQQPPQLTPLFFFYDQSPTWLAILVDQVTDPGGPLSYRYQQPQWPSGSAAPAGAAVTAAAEAPRGAPRMAQIAPLSAPVVELTQGPELKVLPPEPTTVRLALPAAARQNLTAAAASAAAKALVLRIDGVEVPSDRGAVIKVYLNRPDVTAALEGPQPGYVGSMIIVPSTAPGALHAHGSVVRNFGLPLTPELAASLQNQGDISVTLVPVTGETNKPPEVLRYRRVYLATR
jgi:polyphenol oxidase